MFLQGSISALRLRPLSPALVLAGVFLLSPPAPAAELHGRVVGVLDGDTVTVLDADKREHRIRLAEIDAPEKRQAFGQRSKQSLSELCFGATARVLSRGRDRYGRVLGRLSCAGVDANAEQVHRGMAWVYRRYALDLSLYALEDEARAAGRGLWRDPQPVAPWEFRANQHRR